MIHGSQVKGLLDAERVIGFGVDWVEVDWVVVDWVEAGSIEVLGGRACSTYECASRRHLYITQVILICLRTT